MKESPISKKNEENYEDFFATTLQIMVNDLKIRLKEEMKKRGIKTPVAAKQMGIPKDRIYAWYRDDTNPKAEDQQKLEKWLGVEISTKNEGVSQKTPEKMNTLEALIQSNRELSEAHKSLTRSHEELILLMKATVGEQAEKRKADVSMFRGILENLLQVGVDAGTWDTVEEGRIAVGKVAVGSPVAKKAAGKHGG